MKPAAKPLATSRACGHLHSPVKALGRLRSGRHAGGLDTYSRRATRVQAGQQYEPIRREESRALALQPEADPAPYLQPLVRSFLLGVASGALFETVHVASQFLEVLREVGPQQWSQLFEVLSLRSREFAPLIYADHGAGLASWCLFYIMEAFAVSAVLRDLGAVRHTQASAVEHLQRLPKTLVPVQLDRLANGLQRSLEHLSFSRVVLPKSQPGGALETPQASAFLDNDAPLAPTLPRPPAEDLLLEPLPRPAPELPGLIPEDPRPEQEPKAVRPPSLQDRRRLRGLAPGAWDPNASQVARRQAELQGRQAFLKNFWYAAALSEKVGMQPTAVQLLGEQLVLFRDSQGSVHCLSDVCPHRGAPLHKGWVAPTDGHDCIVCPYHGWAFDQEGILRDVPAAEGHDWPEKQMLDTYPVQEKGGFVWVFYGTKALPEAERPPIPYCPELDDPSWRPVYGEIEFDCPHWSVFENAIDMAHIHYLHSGSFGNQEHPEIRDMTCHTTAYGVEASFRLHNKPTNVMWDFAKVPEVHVTAKALLPSTSVISFTLGRGLSFTTFVNTVPLDGGRTINRFALVRRLDVEPIGASFFLSPVWDRLARDAMLKILGEDKAMVEQLRPQALKREISVKADMVQMAFRKLREEYLAMGYGTSPETAANSVLDF